MSLSTNRRKFIKTTAGLLVPATCLSSSPLFNPNLGIRQTAAAGANGLLANLAAHYSFESKASSLWPDDTANDRDIEDTLDNYAVVGGRVDNGAQGQGSGRLRWTFDNTFQTGDIDFTFGFWINLGSIGADQGLFGKAGTGGQREYRFLVLTDGTPQWICYDTGDNDHTAQWGSTLSISTWYHIMCWHDSVNNQIGVSVNNGTPVTAALSGGIATGVTQSFNIGTRGDSGSPMFTGSVIDQFGFWKNRVLGSADKTSHYNGGAGIPYSSYA